MKTGNGVWVEVDELISLRPFASHIFKKADKKSSSPLSGGYVSPFRGRGIDFSEVRLYQPGDEIRSMDWRVTARTGKPHTKLFIEERERSVIFLIDFSSAMYFGTREAFKSVLATKIATLLAWAASGHGDRIGAMLFNFAETEVLKPLGSNRGVLKLINRLSDWSKRIPKNYSEHDHGFEKTLKRSRSIIRPGSLVYLISDFKFLNPASEMLLSEISRHTDVVAIRVQDPIEIEPPDHGNLKITDGKTFSNINCASKETAKNIYLQNQLLHHRIASFCIKHGIHSLNVLTNDDFVEVLRHGLSHRQQITPPGYSRAGSF